VVRDVAWDLGRKSKQVPRQVIIISYRPNGGNGKGERKKGSNWEKGRRDLCFLGPEKICRLS